MYICVYMYLYRYIYVCVCINSYLYIYIHLLWMDANMVHLATPDCPPDAPERRALIYAFWYVRTYVCMYNQCLVGSVKFQFIKPNPFVSHLGHFWHRLNVEFLSKLLQLRIDLWHGSLRVWRVKGVWILWRSDRTHLKQKDSKCVWLWSQISSGWISWEKSNRPNRDNAHNVRMNLHDLASKWCKLF